MALTLALPSYSHAISITITGISATINGNTFGSGAVGAPNWNLPIVLAEGQSLQVGQIGLFNFDTSDGCVGVPGPANCAATITVQTNVGNFTFTETAQILAGRQNGPDSGAITFNEAAQYRGTTLTGGTAGQIGVFTGYYDNVHTDVCTDTASGALGAETAGNCRPDFNATFNRFTGTTFLSTDSNNISTANANHCGTGAINPINLTDCFDSGMIVIRNLTQTVTQTPEPASLLLLVAGGLAGLLARRRW